MPAQPTSTQSRLDNIIRHSTAALNTLEVLARFLETPFLESISKTVRSLLTAAENIKQNKSDCFQLLEQTHQLLSAIVSLHIKSTSGFDLPLSMLNHLGKFTDTLYKVHTYVEAQQDKNKFRQFFRQGEMNTLLKACNDGLHEAFDVFMLHNIDDLANIADISKFAEDRHQEVLQLIETLSEDDMSSKGSLRMFSMFHNSSTSISMLPAEPKIFHGRESELSDLVKLFIQEHAPRVAILGAGGIGKTSLAKAVLHHPQITDKFKEHRFFVVCDSVSTKTELASLIGAHLGLKPGKDLIRPIMHFLSSHSGCLLILDNLEALWEPLGNRRDIEEFLSCLTDIQHLALLITMRGTERPAKVHWTRPFFPSLKPLSREAAQETFIDIVDDGYAQEEVDQVLLLTDNMPLAVNLMAHLVDFEGCSKVLSRWEKETTSVMSDGYDKQSNLDLSISLSITSPRIRSSPGAQDLLSLISMLPDGISDVELLQSQLPIANILGCKATLLATSLAYADENQQLKALKPICEHMQKFHPPKAHIVQALLEHCHVLLDFYMKYEGRSTTSGIIAHISSKHANIRNILLHGLQPQNPKLADTIYSICYLQRFAGISHRKHSPLIDHVPKLLRQSDDHRLQLYFISELLHSNENIISNHEVLIEQALEHVPHVDDSDVKCQFYYILGNTFRDHKNDIPKAVHYYQLALSLSISTGNIRRQSDTLTALAWLKWRVLGDNLAGQKYASEAQRLGQSVGDLWREAQALNIEVLCWISLGNYKHALSLCGRGRGLLSLCGMSDGDTNSLFMECQADIHFYKSEYTEALGIRQQDLNKKQQEDRPYHTAMSLLNLGLVAVPAGVPAQAVDRHMTTAKSLFGASGYSEGVVLSDAVIADLKLREGEILEAHLLFQKCFSFPSGRRSALETYCLERLANRTLWCLADRASWNPCWATVYLAHSLRGKQNLDIFKSLQFMGYLFLDAHDRATAVTLFTTALEEFTQLDIHRSRAECMMQLGNLAKEHGDCSKATELWNAAIPLFEQSSQTKQVVILNEKLAEISKDAETLQNLLANVHTPEEV